MHKVLESALLLYAINNRKCSNSNLFTTLVLLLVLYLLLVIDLKIYIFFYIVFYSFLFIYQ